MPERVSILGATGSIGESTLDVVARHPERFELFGLSAHSRIEELVQLARQHRPRIVAVPDAGAAARFQAIWSATSCGDVSAPPELLLGRDGLCTLASDPAVDVVMAAIVGAAGLEPTLAAVRAGKRILLANKEALVMAGRLLMHSAKQYGARIWPVDSEHNAIFQSLGAQASDQGQQPKGIRKLILTASGGPFRDRDPASLHSVSVAEACHHPNWVMGRKISVDSATMMNKGLEVIEARYLFDLPPEQIEVLIHPASIVHSMVEFLDGSVVAQLGLPDMRTPIAHALGAGERIASGVGSLDLTRVGALSFFAPDTQRYPCLTLAYEALRSGPCACITLNAANEVAVQAFLDSQLPFTGIATLVAEVLRRDPAGGAEPSQVEDCIAIDAAARQAARELLPCAQV